MKRSPTPATREVRNYGVTNPNQATPRETGIDHEILLRIMNQREPDIPLAPSINTLKNELDRLLMLGFIKPSTSPYGTPVFFVKEPTKLRLVFDFRKLNEKTVKNRTALPNMREVIDRLQGAKYFTKLDLMAGFHQIRLAANATAKTAFRTKYGHFEWVVLPFGLCNAPALSNLDELDFPQRNRRSRSRLYRRYVDL